MYTGGKSEPMGDEGFRPSPRQVIGAVIGLLAVIFIVQNSDKQTVEFLFYSLTAPVWIAFVVILLAGAVLGYVGRGVIQSRQLKKAKRDKKKGGSKE